MRVREAPAAPANLKRWATRGESLSLSTPLDVTNPRE